MRRRSFLAATAALPAAPALAQGTRARTLRFVPQANLTSLDPIWTTAAVTENHGWSVFDTLYGMTDDLRVQPQMAEGHTRLRRWPHLDDPPARGPALPRRRAGARAGLRRRRWRAGRGATPSASRSAPWSMPGRRPTTAPSASG